MAAVTAVRVDNKILEGSYDASSVNATRRIRAIIYVNNGATQVAGGTDTLDVNVATLLAAALDNGKTYTLRDWMVFQLAQSSAATFAATGSVSGSTISLTPKTPADWSTNAIITASSLLVPFGIAVIADEN